MAQRKNFKQNQSSTNSVNRIAIIGAIIFAIFFYVFNNKESKIIVDENSKYITQSGFKASYSEESMKTLVNCSVHKDYACIEQLLYSGEVFELPAGQEAYIIKSEYPGKVKIRLQGETQEIWTFIEAIK